MQRWITLVFVWTTYVLASVNDPATNAAPCPVIIFSHGLGGSRDGYEYLGRHWASHGYVSVHSTHIGSDTSALKGTLRPLTRSNSPA